MLAALLIASAEAQPCSIESWTILPSGGPISEEGEALDIILDKIRTKATIIMRSPADFGNEKFGSDSGSFEVMLRSSAWSNRNELQTAIRSLGAVGPNNYDASNAVVNPNESWVLFNCLAPPAPPPPSSGAIGGIVVGAYLGVAGAFGAFGVYRGYAAGV